MSKEVLFGARVNSLGVVNYSEGAARDDKSGLAYFDKVDLITHDQGFMSGLRREPNTQSPVISKLVPKKNLQRNGSTIGRELVST
jgi:hypothetical protein